MMDKLHAEDNWHYIQADLDIKQEKVDAYLKRVKHLLKLIEQPLEMEIGNCNICRQEKWRGHICPTCKK